MCLTGSSSRVTGIGEVIEPGPQLPPDLGVMLIHPGVPVATPHVFRGLIKRDHPPMPELPAAWIDVDHLVDWLEPTRNDLQQAAQQLAPDIGVAMALIRELPGCRFARMSGSGATCFGIFADGAEARAATDVVRTLKPDWWVG